MLYQFRRFDESVLTPQQVNEMLCAQFNISNRDKFYLSWYANLSTMLAMGIEFNSTAMNKAVLTDANELELESLGRFTNTFNKKNPFISYVDKKAHYIEIFNVLQKEFSLIIKNN